MITVLLGATPKVFVFKKLVESIAAALKPEGEPLKVGGKTKSSGLGITSSSSSSVKIPAPNLILVVPSKSISVTNLFGTFFNFKR